MSSSKKFASAALAGLLAAGAMTLVGAGQAVAKDGVHAEKVCCKGKNVCKGKGGCKTDAHACKGHNDCKGKGGCKTGTCE